MLQEFLNNSKTATLVIDDQMKLLFRNKKATEIFQLTDENWSTMLSREIIERASTYSSDQFNPTEGSNKSDERKSIASIVNQAEKLVDIKQARIVVSEGQTADQYVFVDIDYQRLFFEN